MWLYLQLGAATFWASSNVLNSMIVRKYAQDPVVLIWCQTCFSIVIFLSVAVLFPLSSRWVWPLFTAGMLGYVGDLVFFRILNIVDVSVSNIAWVFLSVILSVLGFAFFHEVWSLPQTVGVIAVLLGTILLSLWGKHIPSAHALLLLLLLATLYMPFYFMQKMALLNGDATIAVFFWSMLGRDLTSFITPLLIPSLRHRLFDGIPPVLPFHLFNACVILLFFSATYLTTLAFRLGPVSLVSIVGNVQLFLVLALAVLVGIFLPGIAPREGLTIRSFSTKTISFLIAFLGLALLAVHQ